MYDIILHDHLCRVKPWRPELAPLLTYNKREFDNWENTYDIIPTKLYTVEKGVGVFPIGLWAKVKKALKAEKIKYKIMDLRGHVSKPIKYRLERIEELREGQARVLAAIMANERGVIECATGWGKTFLIRQLCRALPPQERILIITPGRDDARALLERVSEGEAAHTVGLVGAGSAQIDARIVVSTARSVTKLELHKFTYVMVDEAHQCGDNLISRYLVEVGESRMFGFTASPNMRSDGADMEMEALLGPVIARIDYKEAVKAGVVTPVTVHMYPVDGVPCDRKTPVGRKRACYWRNKRRNDTIAAVVESLGDEQILVMVDTIEHGLRLRKLLPDFTFIYRSPSNSDWEKYRRGGLVGPKEQPIKRKEQDEARSKFKEGKLRKVICTTIWKQAVDFPDLKWLVRADGGASGIENIQKPGRLSRIAEGKDQAIMIDFLDEFDPWAKRRAQTRIKWYKQMKWKIKYKDLK